jgi:regulator of sigma E protease
MLVTIIVFLLVLSVIVFVHELGHFYTAIKLGIGVEEFGFGFPPRMFGIKRKGILYSINWIPLGGFVKIKGEDGNNSDDDSFANQAVWKRAIVLFAGVFMNWVLAFVLLTVGYFVGLPAVLEGDVPAGAVVSDEKVQIIEVYPGSVADQIGLEAGDIVLSVDNQNFNDNLILQKYLQDQRESEINFKVERGKEEQDYILKAEEIPDLEDEKLLGVGLVKSGIVSYPWYQAPIEGFKTVINITYLILMAFVGLIANLIRGSGGADISGPIGVAVFANRALDMGWIYLLQFTALISINLAVINILPFPALDGGRILFLIIEKIRRKPNNQKIEAIVHNIGFSLLMLLIVLITYKDIVRYGGGIISKIGGLF